MVSVTPSQADLLSPEAVAFLKQNRAAGFPGPVTPLVARLGRRKYNKGRPEQLQRYVHNAGIQTRQYPVGSVTVFEFTPPQPSAPDAAYAINIHGGAFMLGSANDPYPALMAQALGMPVISIEYSLTPERVYPVALEECVDVIQTLQRTRGIGYVLLGDSAGGNLALAALERLDARGVPAPLALGLSTPVVDQRGLGDSWIGNHGRDPVIRWKGQLDKLFAKYRGGVDPTESTISPILRDFPPGFPPTVVVSSTRDPLLSDSVRLVQTLQRAGGTAELQVHEGLWHDFITVPGIPEAAVARTELADRLRHHVGG